MKPLSFVNASIDDLPFIVEVYNSTVASRLVTADMLEVSIRSKEKWFYEHHEKRPLWIILENNENAMGWISVQSFYGRPAYDKTVEISIYLHEDYRNKGYGKLVLDLCLKKLKQLGIENVMGFIFAHNEPSLKLFYNAGFEDWGLFPEIADFGDEKYSLKIVGLKLSH